MANQTPEQFYDSDMDALHILPLSILPFENPFFAHTRMIKNTDLDSVIEVFSDKKTGSGQFTIDGIAHELGWAPGHPPPDLILLKKLTKIPSYDVFSLRILLRKHGIRVNNIDTLQLSETKKAELGSYMRDFTRPLIRQIYGGDVEINNFDDIVALFHNPDTQTPRQHGKSCN